jgi:class 3 adenylate cyclase/tetratricopeptide (TPR) repeat protein
MNCPRCGADTRPNAKFCAECGLALSATCPHCGAPVDPGQKYCAECGTSLVAPTTSGQPNTTAELPAAERRFVTVLFGDLVGFTTLAEAHDPEAVRELLSSYFDVARQVIESFGGTVEKFIGDAVMAVWGAPVAREDDPERAVRAGLELVARVRRLSLGGTSLALRAGVVSGEAAVTPGRVGEGMVAGDVVNTASRLQSVAQPGAVLVGEATYRATSPSIAYEAAGEQALKGKEAPVPAWRALRVVARVGGQGRDDALEPPFVGRDEDLRQLVDEVHAAERERRVRFVTISGQAGIGKTRLLWELEKYLDGLAGHTYYWNQGRSPAYGEGISFWALGEMVRRRAGITEGEDELTTRAKLRASLEALVSDEDERAWLEPALGALLGIVQADWAAREQLFSAWRTYFERVADMGPTVLAFEDLQWADDGLLDFIEHVLDWTRDKPMLIVTLARPELLERRPNFGMGHRALLALHLEPLPGDAMGELVHGLVPHIGSAELERIVDRAEGVPLYAVETIRSLADAGSLVRRDDAYELVGQLPALDIPPSLRAWISARLDSLDAAERSLVQAAAVIGQVFAAPAVAALAGGSEDDVRAMLRSLARKELISLESDPRSPERGQYGFTQGLVREVAYATLSKRDRRVRHLAAARYYDTLDDDELAGVVATHYVQAFKAAPEGEEGAAVAAQARVALRAAADRALNLHSYVQALDYYQQALAVTFDEGEVNDLRVRAARAAAAALLYDRADEMISGAIEWSERRGDDAERTLEWMAARGGWMLENSRVDEGFEVLEKGIAAGPSRDGRAQIYLYGQLARAYLFRAQGEQALDAVSRALEAAQRLHYDPPLLHLLITKSWALGHVGRGTEGVALLIGAMALADRARDVNTQTRARFNLSGTLLLDDPRRALAIALEGVDLCTRFGINPAGMAGNAASCALMIGDLDTVFRLEDSVTGYRTTLGSFLFGNAAAAAALRGDLDGAARRLDAVEEAVAGSSSAQDVRELRHEQALVAFAAGNLNEAHQLAVEAVDLFPGSAGAVVARVLAGSCALLMGDADAVSADVQWLTQEGWGGRWTDRSRRTIEAGQLVLQGRRDDAALHYRELIEEWRDNDLPYDLALTLIVRAVLLGVDDREATDGLAEARGLLAGMGAESLADRLMAAAAPRPAAADVPTGAGRLTQPDAATARR